MGVGAERFTVAPAKAGVPLLIVETLLKKEAGFPLSRE
jgi:hypothetical protein